jgi:hypothetical protein
MKLKRKPIENVRIRKDRAEILKNLALEISLKTQAQVTESDLVNFLIDEGVTRIEIEKDALVLK